MRETFLTLLGGRLRAWHVVSVIGVVAVISIAWGFMHRSRIGSHEIAIIQAPEGPMKVKPNIETDQDAPQTGGATVLDRKETAPVKQVVNNQEQAVDPKVQPQTLKIGNDPVNAPHEAPSLAEPHRVKSVTVRPDGSPASGMNALPPAVVAKPVSNLEIEASQQGGTPKTLARPVTTAQVVKPKSQRPLNHPLQLLTVNLLAQRKQQRHQLRPLAVVMLFSLALRVVKQKLKPWLRRLLRNMARILADESRAIKLPLLAKGQSIAFV